MCKIMDDLIKKERAEAVAEVLANRNKEIVINLLKTTKLSESEIASNLNLTLKEVEDLSKEIRK